MSRYSPQRRKQQQQLRVLQTTTQKSYTKKQVSNAALWVGIVFFSVATSAVLLYFAYTALASRAVYENPRFTLKNISIQSGNIPKAQIQRAGRLAPGQNLMALDLQQIQKDIQRLPYVAEAEIRRQVPDTLVIRIKERVPMLRVLASGGDLGSTEVYYLDREGVLLKPRAGEAVASLPQVTGLRQADLDAGQRLDQPGLRAAIDLIEQLDQMPLRTAFDINVIDVSRTFAMKVFTKQGGCLTFRLEYIDQQLNRLAEIFEIATNRNREIATVDLTPDKNVPVTFLN
jgi:cell division protein FtsQ